MKRIRVAAGVVFDGGKVLVARRSAERQLGGLWEFPGGKIEGEETAEECLVRELDEELGLTDVIVLRQLGDDTHCYEFGEVKLLTFLCSSGQKPSRLTSHDLFKWANIAELADFEWAPADLAAVARLQTNTPPELA